MGALADDLAAQGHPADAVLGDRDAVDLPAAVLGALDEQPGHHVARDLPGHENRVELPLHAAVEGSGQGACGHVSLLRRRRGPRPISAGRVRSSMSSAPRSWAAVRAPTIGRGHARAGRAPTTSATSSGVQPRPSAARATASTTCCGAVVEVGADEGREVRGRRAGVRRRAGAVLAGQHAAAQRRPRQHAEAQRLRGRQHLLLDGAVEQRVLHLRGGQRGAARDRPLPGGGLRGLPAGVVRDPDVRRPAAADGEVQRAERLLERRVVGPQVHLPQVDVVHAEAPQRGVERARAGDPGRRRRTGAPRARGDRRPWWRSPRRRAATTSPSSVPMSSSEAPLP